jgi:hypothetical protein
MKKVIIFQHGGGELANQLWNYASIYAYCIEKKYALKNPSFFEYAGSFAFPRQTSNIFFKLFFISPFKNYTKRRNSFKRELWRGVYKCYIAYVRFAKKSKIVSSKNSSNTITYLLPTQESPEKLKKLEQKTFRKIYFEGWLFRNPKGLDAYREHIIKYFRPQKSIEKTIVQFMKPIREKFQYVIGVHIRQGDYLTFKDGAYFINQRRVRQIIDEYLQKNNLSNAKTFFIIASDGKINDEYFQGLNYIVSKQTAAEDLFLLSATDTVIGSDSSFGDFAAYYGNIPHLVLKREPIDWEYYRGKKGFFQNKYSTLVHY